MSSPPKHLPSFVTDTFRLWRLALIPVGVTVLLGMVLLLFVLQPLTGSAPPQVPDSSAWLQWNQPAQRAACLNSPSFAWVEHAHGQECIRYFAGADIQGTPVVIVQFYGDRDRVMRQPIEDIRNNTQQTQEGYAASQTRRADGLPVVVMARPGTYGSSGDHRQRRQIKEFYSINAALDVLQERYAIEKLVLLGHSGGATAAAAVLTLGRPNVRCAVLSSGAYSLLTRAEMLRETAGRAPRPGRDTTGLENPYDPLEYVAGIVSDTARHIIILGNARDTVTPFELQQEFAAALKAAGHRVAVEEHPAAEPSYHRLTGNIGIQTAALCGQDRP